MEKTRKWRKILAMMLTVVMMLQNAQSVMVFADVTNEQIEQRLAGNQGQTEETQPAQSQVDTRANGEEYKTQSQETQENGNGSTDIGSPESGNATTEAKTSNADVSAIITQSVFQADVSGTTCNFVQMTAQITNNDAENPATGVSVKALLNSAQLSWVNGYGTETAGAGAYAVDSNNTADLPDGSADGYDQIVMWTDQTIGAGETVAYQFAAQLIPENLDGVVNAWYVDGTSCSYTWENTEILVPTQAPVESTPEVAPPQTEPEEKPEVKPEETTPEVTEAPEVTPAPEVTEVPEATPTPEVTEVPEATPTPEVTEVPEATPTPEVTEVPEATPTPEPTQAVDDDKQAILDKQDKLLSQSSDRLNIKKSAKKKAKEQAGEGDDQPVANGDEAPVVLNDLKTFLTNAQLASSPQFGDTIYDPENPAVSNGFFYLRLDFAEGDDNHQFPVYDPNDPNATTVTYQMPSGITGFDAVQNFPIKDPDDSDIVFGTYDITEEGKLSIKFNETVNEYSNCAGYIIFQAKFNKTSNKDTWEEEIVFSSSVKVKVDFKKGDKLSAKKTASEYRDGKFVFTIEIVAEEDQTGVSIEDSMGENLVLDSGSIKLDGTAISASSSSDQSFKVDNLTLTEGTHRITYEASIKDDALLAYETIPGLENTAIIKSPRNADLPVHGDAEYTHKWLQKSNTGIDSTTGKVRWTITLTPPSGKDVSGMTITDSLPGEGLNYDTSTPIIMKNTRTGTETDLSWFESVRLGEDAKSWSYTMPENSGSDTYTFTYFTTVTGKVTGILQNTATINGQQTANSDVTIPDGIGTGTGKVEKKYVDYKIDEQTKVKYLKWESKLTIPANVKNQKVTYRDSVFGTHSLVENMKIGGNGYDAIIITGYDTTGLSVTQDGKTFTIDFGNITTENAPLEITVTYWTKADSTGIVSNTGELTVGNKVASDDASETLNDTVYRKYGNVNSSTGVITWRIVINTAGNQLNGVVSVKDTFSDNQEYIENSAKYTEGSKAAKNVYAMGSGNTREFILGTLTTTEQILLEYQTRLKSDVDRTDNVIATNSAQITVNNEKSDSIPAKVTVPSNIFDKKLLTKPESGNSYVADFEIDVNSVNMQLNADDYTIQDTLSSNMELQLDTLKILDSNGNPLSSVPNENNPYYVLTYQKPELKIVIKNAEKNTTSKSYKITYSAQINVPSGIGFESWDNEANFIAGKYKPSSSVSGDIQKEQGTESGMSGSKKYIDVYKYDAVTSVPLANAKFALYEVNDDGKETLVDGPKDTGADGKTFFGQPKTGNVTGYYALSEGKKYHLVETEAPNGYVGGYEAYFQIGNKIKDTKYPSVINHYVFQAPNIQKTSVSVTKEWKDAGNKYNLRPNSIKVYLNKEVGGVKTLKYKEIDLKDGNNWQYTWSNLPKYEYINKSYQEVKYSVEEEQVSNYDTQITGSAIDGFTITNAYTIPTTTKQVQKQWVDNNNNDGKRPDNITLTLYSNGEPVTQEWLKNNYYDPYKAISGEDIPDSSKVCYRINDEKNWNVYTAKDGAVEVTGDSKIDIWKCEWKNLPDISGVTYTVKETSENPNGYTTSYDGDTIKNTYTPETTFRTVTKTWTGKESDENGNRPSKVTVKLYKGNGAEPYRADGIVGTQTLSAANNWTYTWKPLPKYENGEIIEWTIKEEPVPGYTTTYSPENGVTSDSNKTVTVTNKYSNETTSISASKIWIDNNNADNRRPDSITLRLQKSVYSNGQYTEMADVEGQPEKTISKADWSATVKWEGLPKYENGYAIRYSVVENNVKPYNSVYSPEFVYADAPSTSIQVTNSYSSKASVQFKAYKNLEGNRDVSLKDKEFTFLLKEKAGDSYNTIQTKQNDISGNVAFAPIEFTKEGTYNYTISEEKGNATTIEYDKKIYTIEVKVGNDSSVGKLEVESVEVDGVKTNITDYRFNFTNTYKAEGQGSIIGTKTLTGGTLTDGLFHFGLYDEKDTPVKDENNNPITATNQNGKFTLVTPKYTQNDIGKTYTYHVKEIVDNTKANIYTYDEHTWKVHISIKDSVNSNGKLSVIVSTADGSSEFKNTYKADGSLVLTALKTVSGRDDVPDEKFTFNLYESNENKIKGNLISGQSVKNKGNSISFKPINYSASDIGETYYYLMKEDQTPIGGYTLSDKAYWVKVKISDTGNGKLKVEYQITDTSDNSIIFQNYGDKNQQKKETPVFENIYHATGKIVLKGKKILEGKTLDITKSENKFQFKLYDASTDQQIGNAVDIDERGEFSFPELSFNEKQLGKHIYQIEEINAGASGYTYSDPISVTVNVSDNGDGTLKVTSDKNGTDNNNGIIFTNYYRASVNVPLQVKKILNGRAIENEQFSFILKKDGETDSVETKACNGDGIAKFTPLNFDQTQVGNTYTYIISEEKPSQMPEGYKYSDESYKVTIKISDPVGNGNLAADVKYIKLVNGQPEGQELVYNDTALTFTNEYTASGEYEISGNKALIGGNKKLSAGDFTFELYDKDPSTEGANPIKTVTNEADGQFTFGKLTYTQDDVDKTTHTGTYTYYVKEKNDNKSGYQYDSTAYIVTLTVSDEDGNGHLTVTPVIAKNGEEGTVTAIQFNNIFKAAGEVVLQANKSLTGKALTAGAFEFTLTGNGQNQSKNNQEVENEASGNVIFDPIKYTQDDIGKTYTYEIREKKPDQPLPGYTYSEDVYLAKVAVSDQNGEIKTDVKYYLKNGEKEIELEEGKVPTFQNSYEASGKVTISGVKELTGNKALVENLFTFVLKDADGNKIAEAQNTDKGTFTFETINYNQNDVDPVTGNKDYTYYVEENPVAEGAPYTTSKVVYKVVVHVENDPETAELKTSTTVTVEKNDAEETTDVEKLLFVNNYNANGQLELTAKKTLNVPLKEGQFTFILSGNGNSEYQEVTNDAEGNINFAPLTYTEDDINGYYYYTVHEKDLHITGYTYSDEIYQIKVHVTDAGDGALRVEKEITNVKGEPIQEMIFQNTYGADGELVLTGEKSYASSVKETKLEAGVYKFEVIEGDKVVATGANDTDGKITFTPIKYTVKADGTSDLRTHLYTVREVKGTNGYVIYDSTEYTVTVDVTDGQDGKLQAKIAGIKKDGKTVDKISFVNDLTKVQISKKSVTGTGELEDAELEIRDLSGNSILKWKSGKTAKYVEGLLKAGEKYVLVETKAPKGYHIAADVPFTVNSDGKIKEVTMIDSPTEVTVSKTDATQEKQLSGAKLQILDKDGNVIDEWTTDGKPHPVTKTMEAGVSYTLHEVEPPKGYRKAEDIKFTVNDNGKATNVVMKDAPTKASILKTDESGKALAGATLVIKDSEGNIVGKEWTSDGKAHEITGLLTVGETYTLSEVSAPSGYTVAPDQTFKMEDKDVIEVTMVDYQASGSGQITVTKKVTYANGGDFIDLIAQDDTFYVNLFTDAAGKYPYKGALPQAIHLVNASAGSVTFSDLAQGTYYVYETDANGNVINLDQQGMHNGSQFMCTVDGGSNTVKLDLKAGPKEGAVNLENVFFDIPTGYSYKGEININKQVLKGTTQTTTDDTFYAGVFTKGDDGVYNLFTVVTLVQNDTVTVEVPLGGKDGTEPINYYILETDADGNILDLDVFEYEVTGEGTVALSKDNLAGNINLVNKIPEDTDGKLRVQKTDGNGVGLAGASFRLTDEDGSVIDEWTSEASAHELELEPGTYTLTEVQAPTGYTGAGSVTIKVDDDYNFSVSGEIDYSYKGGLLKIVNKATTSTPSSGTPVSGGSTPASYSSALSGKVAVKTGDNTPIGAYAAVLVIAALAIAGGIFYKKKRKNDK